MDGAAAWGWHGCLRLFSFLYVVAFNVFLSGRLSPTLLFTVPRTYYSQAVLTVARDRSRALSLVLATFHRQLARRLCWYCLPYAKSQVCFDPVRSFHCTRAVYSSSSLHSDVRFLAQSTSTVSSLACISSSGPSHASTTSSFSATSPSPKHSCATVHVPIIPRISRTSSYTSRDEVWYSPCSAMKRTSIENGNMHAFAQQCAIVAGITASHSSRKISATSCRWAAAPSRTPRTGRVGEAWRRERRERRRAGPEGVGGGERCCSTHTLGLAARAKSAAVGPGKPTTAGCR